MKSLIVFILSLCFGGGFSSSSFASVPLKSIDSLYIESVEVFYAKAERLKDDVWEGMELAPVCLFRDNGPALLYNHPNPPAEMIKLSENLYLGSQESLKLFGTTQVLINGVLTAIVNYGMPVYSSPEEAWAELFHELHHVYQRNFITQLEFDNPSVMLTYPEEFTNDAIKLYEQKLLFEMCREQERDKFDKLMNQFYSCRLARRDVIGDYLNYDIAVESCEGPAFFSEYQFYNHIANCPESIQENYRQVHFFNILTTPYYGRQSLRKRHLASGLAMSIILKNNFKGWQKEYYSDSKSLYDFFISKFNPLKEELLIDSSFIKMSRFYTSEVINGHRIAYNLFKSQEGVKVTLEFSDFPRVGGLDPMNAESLNDSTVLHSTLLRLVGGDGGEMFMTNRKAITVYENDIWFVNRVVLYVPHEEIELGADFIEISGSGINVNWRGNVAANTGVEIVFLCD